MLQMIKGASIANPDALSEGYILYENRIIANVNADNIRSVIEGFININKGTGLFLFIEVPANLDDENVIEKLPDDGIIADTLHKDVYYLDGISSNALTALLEPFYEILVNDGLSAFGIGNPSGDEIGKYKYNQMVLYSPKDLSNYTKIFDGLHISRTDSLISAYDTFSEEAPGICERYEDSEKRDIYSVIEVLNEIGLYKAEQREE